jgi:bacteriocin biosynthesis cyclodehydratase domain-containing protein
MSFPVPDRAAVRNLIEELEQRRILVPGDEAIPDPQEPEGALEIFYWHFAEHTERVNERLTTQKIIVVGVNAISKALVMCLTAAGISDIVVIDHPMLRNLRLFDGGVDLIPNEWGVGIQPIPADQWVPDTFGCLVATSDFGGGQALAEWNAFCLDRRYDYFPVVLQDLVGYLGPLVVPGESACFECMKARWNSNVEGLESRWDVLQSDSQRVIGFHPAMPAMLGALAAFELTKFYGLRLPFTAVGRLIEVNMLTMRMDNRKVLKVPRCPACSSLNVQQSASLTKSWFGLSQDN